MIVKEGLLLLSIRLLLANPQLQLTLNLAWTLNVFACSKFCTSHCKTRISLMSECLTLWSSLVLPCIPHLISSSFFSHEELFSWSWCNGACFTPNHLQNVNCHMLRLVLWRLLGLLPKIVYCWLLFPHQVKHKLLEAFSNHIKNMIFNSL